MNAWEPVGVAGRLLFCPRHRWHCELMKSLERIDFPTLVRTSKPNTFLLAPEGLCANAKPDVNSRQYETSAAQLRQAFLRVALSKPRVSHTLKDDVALYDNLVSRSALFRFPDLIAAAMPGPWKRALEPRGVRAFGLRTFGSRGQPGADDGLGSRGRRDFQACFALVFHKLAEICGQNRDLSISRVHHI
jgi:hypothetical protein